MNNEKQFIDFRKEVEKLREIDSAEEYAKQLAHLFLGNGLSLQTILLMAIDFGQQHPQWIPVEERLPDLDDDVLVYDSAENRMFVAHHAGDWYTTHGDILLGVTHWMEIVPPRKEEDNE